MSSPEPSGKAAPAGTGAPDQTAGRWIVTPAPAIHEKADAEVTWSQNLLAKLTLSVFVGF